MAWIGFQDDGGESWRIEQTGCWLLIRSFVRSEALRRRASIQLEHQDLGMGVGLDLQTLAIDFHGLKEDVDTKSRKLMTLFENQATRSGRQAFNALVDMRYLALGHEQARKDLAAKAWAATSASIERSVRIGKIGEGATQFLRDASEITLTAVGTFASGGALGVAIGGGAVVKGVAKYMETGRVADTLLEAGADVIVGILHIKGPAGSVAERRALIVAGTLLEGQLEVAKSLVEGKRMGPAVRDAMIQAGVGALAPAAVAKLGGKALPVLSRLSTSAANQVVKAVGREGVKELADEYIGDRAKKAADTLTKKYLDSNDKPEPQLPPSLASVADCCQVAASRPFASPLEYVELTAMKRAFY